MNRNLEDNLAAELTTVILEHYGEKEVYEICEKVKFQVIPILITQFFQSSNNLHLLKLNTKQRNSNNSLNQLLSPNKLTHSFQKNSMIQHDPHFHQQLSNKQNNNIFHTFSAELQKISSKKQQQIEYFRNFIQSHKKQTMKIIGMCMMMNFVRQKQMRNLYRVFMTIKNGSKLEYFALQQQKHKKNSQFFQIMQKFFQKNIKSAYLRIYTQSAHIHQTKQIAKNCSKETAIKLIRIFLKKKQKQYFQTLNTKSHYQGNLEGNRWDRIWIRAIALKTTPNLQTSFWRLRNYGQHARSLQKGISILQKMLFRRAISDFKSIQQCKQTDDLSLSLFSVEQRAQIFMNHIQLVLKVLVFNQLLEGFEAIQNFSSTKKYIESIENSSNKML